MAQRIALFDWGGTLMRVMPRWIAAQGEWTREEAVPHVAEVLEHLSGAGWRMGLASNASESDEAAVRRSLDTIGVGRFMERIYTWRSVGTPKPWPPFWHHIVRDFGVDPRCMVMIGDDWMGDVWGANEVGLRAVWFNPHSDDVREAEGIRTMKDFRNLPEILAELGF